jgi:Asp-tRNA(Asn)/Glu-tRNA(Gln) amidotransferase A subunit family amidase
MALVASMLCGGWQASPRARDRPALGVPEGVFLQSMTDTAREAYEDQLQRLEQAGYQVRRVAVLDQSAGVAVYARAMDVLHYEMAQVHAPWFTRYSERYRPRTARAVIRGQGTTEDAYAAGLAGQATLRAELERLAAAAGIDLWVTPSSAAAAPEGLETTGWGGMTTPWSYAGLPCVSLPAATAGNGMPLGLQLVAPFMGDELLLAWSKPIATVFPRT